MRTGSSARPSCCCRMGNPVCVSCHPIFSPSWLSSCACQNLVFVSATWVFTLAFCLSLSVKQGLRWEVLLLLIKHVDNVNLFLTSYSKCYSTTKGNTQGLKQQGEWQGKGSLCILAYPSGKLATLSQHQQTCRAKFPFSTHSGHGWASQHPSFLNTEQNPPPHPYRNQNKSASAAGSVPTYSWWLPMLEKKHSVTHMHTHTELRLSSVHKEFW